MANRILEVLSISASPVSPLNRIFCSNCGVRSIPAPEGSSCSTRYTCPACCTSLLKSRDEATADTLAAIGMSIDRRHSRETISVAHIQVTGG